ncbi:AAA family ATPase [Paenibacillus larvae]|uniref:Nuclease SbcCD subunit C n=1 Tax=Paenibacillus larvae subsp. larvae DSM 25430 TaxID=697284 RepID=V9WB46_9BACL|nr:AAA family ATPase [Paenibacillus larvae]AHD06332.1 nuclease sbcCD subunit C [Paenibacillus larvae subsp. larvae DSM 25430]AVG12871.1 nuclease sbcCD subunit C [Paenibacillus larvae subsp. larvae DSM 25430]MDR5569121.1 AAA family ATPase [Paenibacillus larvae]MDR5596605.1 AAA family ATPase [Paenibacillus larvae]
MRPITLTLSGLQSYREKQEVDFTRLCDAGVFGIFGPTGSGKSTLLDAITLALYGKVERASSGTQGIMNQAENSLAVSFIFELSHAGGSTRYRVERQFKRGSGVSATGVVSRLILEDPHNPENSTVLADKATEVTQQVQDILGLSMQDFTRAVVLPQGKFAEFLSLTGKDRRQMLQRLFHLELYGDQLTVKISLRMKEAEQRLKELSAEQQGLGDASEEALKKAEKELVLAQCEGGRLKRELGQDEQEYEEQKQVWQWVKDRERVLEERDKLAENEDKIREKEVKVRLAGEADRLLPYLTRQEKSARLVTDQRTQLQASCERLEYSTAREKAARRFMEQCQAELQEREYPLLKKLEKLQEALQLEKELDELKKQMDTLKAQEALARDEASKTASELQTGIGRRQKGLEKQAALKEELRQTEVPFEESRRIQSAYSESIHVKEAERLVLEQEEEARKHRKFADQAEQTWKMAEEKFQAIGQDLLKALPEVARQLHGSSLSVKKSGHLLEQAGNLLESYKQKLKQEERQSLAAVLAEELREGCACPVCGSMSHPSPAHYESTLNGIKEWEAKIVKVEELRESLRGLNQAFGQQEAFWSGLSRQWLELLPETAASYWQETATAIEGNLVGEMLKDSLEPDGQIEQIGLITSSLQEELLQMVHSRQEKEQQTALFKKDLSLFQQQAGEISSRYKLAVERAESEESRLRERKERLNQLVTLWNESYPGLSMGEIAEQMKLLSDKEEKAAELRSRLDKSVPFLEQLERDIEEWRSRAAELDKTVLQLQTRLEGQQQLAEAKAVELRSRVGEADAPSLIRQAEEQLSTLREQEQQAKQSQEAALEGLQQAAREHSAAERGLAAAEQQLKEAQQAFAEVLAESGFAEEKSVKAAVLAKEQQLEWQELIERYREHERELRLQLRELDGKLLGRTMSSEQWAAAERQMREIRERYEVALTDLAKAEYTVQDLRTRHEQWVKLEQHRADTAVKYKRLSKLQSVCKGNAFVEFLAEEQLVQVSRAASDRLGQLTRQRYAIEVDSGGGFIMRDDGAGGVRRPVSTLSGGETFLTSLALALALSAQIQLKGQYPLEFFFLDEGFGTLDPELLDMVVTALEKLHTDKLSVGVISHVPELRARLARKLVIHPAEPLGRGSRIELEVL